MSFESRSLAEALIRNLPGNIGLKIRALYYSGRFKSCGTNPRICESVFFDGAENICMGDRVGINRFCFFQGACGIDIGNDVLIGPHTMVESLEHIHRSREIPISRQGYSGGKVTIEDGVWVGMGVSVLPGVTIGEGCIIGAGSVVTKNVPSYEIHAGVPARKIGSR